MRTLLAVVLALGVSGCLSNTPIVPVTPDNKAAINQCVTDSDVHNAAVWVSAGAGATGTTLGIIAAADTNSNDKVGLAIGAAVAAGVTAIAGGGVGLTNSLYVNSGCPQLTGPLPVLGKDGRPKPL